MSDLLPPKRVEVAVSYDPGIRFDSEAQKSGRMFRVVFYVAFFLEVERRF